MIVQLKLLLQEMNVLLLINVFFPYRHCWIACVTGHGFVVTAYQLLKYFGLHSAKLVLKQPLPVEAGWYAY